MNAKKMLLALTLLGFILISSTFVIGNKSLNLSVIEHDGAIPDQRDGAIPDQRDGAIPDQRDGAIPDQRDGAIPDQRDGAIPDKLAIDIEVK